MKVLDMDVSVPRTMTVTPAIAVQDSGTTIVGTSLCQGLTMKHVA